VSGGIGEIPERWADEEFCYLTTTGRRTERPHEIEIWFGVHEGRVYLLSGRGERADWVKNLHQDQNVTIRVADETRRAVARVVSGSEDHPARRVIAAKYRGLREEDPLSEWAARSTLIELSEFTTPEGKG
jgi:deazaflavin-dependent oxidoreductase (nitroreductase family)